MDKFEKKIIKDIVALMDEHNLSQLEYSNEKNTYKLVKKDSESKKVISSKILNNLNKEDQTYNDEVSDKSIKAPLVGTVYLSPEPGAKPFIEIGQSVKVGQVLLIIEAMKTMNEITSNKNGQIKKIFVKNSDPVEFGEPLILIE